MFHVGVQCPDERRIDLREFRKHQVANAVALRFILSIGPVLAIRHAVLPRVLFDIFPCHPQQRPHQPHPVILRDFPEGCGIFMLYLREMPEGCDCAGLYLRAERGVGGHAGDAAEAGAAEEVQDERLGVVVGVMGDGHGVEAVFRRNLREPCVAQFARSHLDADAVFRSV